MGLCKTIATKLANGKADADEQKYAEFLRKLGCVEDDILDFLKEYENESK